MDQDRLIHPVGLGDLEVELLGRFLEVGPIKDNNAVGAASWFESGLAQLVVADFKLIRDDAFALSLFLLRGFAARDLDLRRNDLDGLIGVVQD